MFDVSMDEMCVNELLKASLLYTRTLYILAGMNKNTKGCLKKLWLNNTETDSISWSLKIRYPVFVQQYALGVDMAACEAVSRIRLVNVGIEKADG